MFSLIADRCILSPTRNQLFAGGKVHRTLPYKSGHLELWTHRAGGEVHEEPRLFVLSLSAAEGRAERATAHPLDYWTDVPATIWALNPPGYGGSSGRASLKSLAKATRATFEAIQREADGRPILVNATCIGATAALHLAANYNIAGLILRNVPPVRQVVMGRFAACTLWIGARAIADQIPRDLDSLANARRVTSPAVFVMSGQDPIVPLPYQEKVVAAYAGPKQELLLPAAGHNANMKRAERQQYAQRLDWLREQILGDRVAPPRYESQVAFAPR